MIFLWKYTEIHAIVGRLMALRFTATCAPPVARHIEILPDGR
jgi:hypothetical protein